MFPVTGILSAYPRRGLRPDLVAGTTLAALALPWGMAYAEVAGLAPVAGLYALLLPLVAYAVFGSSRELAFGPALGLFAIGYADCVLTARSFSGRHGQHRPLLGRKAPWQVEAGAA